jgi:hypothetical protein
MYTVYIYGTIDRKITIYTVKYGVHIYGSGQPYKNLELTILHAQTNTCT